MAQLLEQPGQTYRVIIHTLAKLGYRPAVARIRPFTGDRDQPTASAAITAICRLTADYDQMDKVVALLQHPKVLARRLSIQDLMDAQYYPAIPGIARCPVSIVFRLRGIRALGESGIAAGALTFAEHVQPFLEQALRDHPSNLALVHSYAQTPDLPTAIRGLYDTDFGRCYLAAKTILDHYADTAAEALLTAYAEEARQDYGAHFHVVKLLGWLKHHPAYDLLVEALHNTQPQFQKSRAAAAIALGELGDRRAISELKNYLESRIWDLKYAALLALEKLGHLEGYADIGPQDDWLIREKATQRH